MSKLKFDKRGLVTAVVQDIDTKAVLMVAAMDAQAYALTRTTKLAHFWSRSRQQLWLKGETSGNFLKVIEMKLDCDGDAVLILAKPAGPACHTGATSCFNTIAEI